MCNGSADSLMNCCLNVLASMLYSLVHFGTGTPKGLEALPKLRDLNLSNNELTGKCASVPHQYFQGNETHNVFNVDVSIAMDA